MRTFTIDAVLLFLTLVLCACSAKTDSIPIAPPEQILEITSDFRGLWWMNGNVLDFRLYADGTAEYDEYPLSSDNLGVLKADEVKSLKRVTIKKSDFDVFLALLRNGDVFKSKTQMNPVKFCTDAFIDTKITVTIGHKLGEIAVNGHCESLTSSERTTYVFGQFPVSLNELFHQINRVRDRHSPGRFYR